MRRLRPEMCIRDSPNTIALEEVERIFIGMGYEVVEGPEVEYDLYNFEKLNIPANHPAKDEQDTFYINKEIVLRTQTSPVQARVMEQGKLPIRMIAPGRVFRSDEVDATHSPSFHPVSYTHLDVYKRQAFLDQLNTGDVEICPFSWSSTAFDFGASTTIYMNSAKMCIRDSPGGGEAVQHL